MMNQFQNVEKKIHFSQQIKNQIQQLSQKTIYFRCADKKTFIFDIRKGDDLNSIKYELLSSLKCQFSQILLIYKGREVSKNQQLLLLPTKSIVHVVNLKNAASLIIGITINFYGQFKQSFEVQSSLKIGGFMKQIKNKIDQFIPQQLVLINLGKVLDCSKSFKQELVENGTQLYAAKALKKTFQQKNTINNHIPPIQKFVKKKPQQLEQHLNLHYEKNPIITTVSEENKQSIAENFKLEGNQIQILSQQTAQTNKFSSEIPISTVFNVHEQFNDKSLVIPKDNIQKFNQTLQKQSISLDSIFDISAKQKKIELKLSKQDFLFYSTQNLIQTQFFLKNALLSLKQSIKKCK